MAVYVTPQPLWKRNAAGVLDFLLCLFAFGLLLSVGSPHLGPVVVSTPSGTVTHYQFISLDGWRLPAFIGMTIAYFLALGRSGGTVFQRLFGMKRA